MTPCIRCGSERFGHFERSTGKVSRYCRDCQRKRAYKRLDKKKANGGSHTNAEWLEKLSQYDKCPDCGRAWGDIPLRKGQRYKQVTWTKNHIILLDEGGTDDISNIRPSCYQCNFGYRKFKQKKTQETKSMEVWML